MKQKKLFALSNEAVEKLQVIADRSNLSNSQIVEALIMLADEQNLKISVAVKTEYKAKPVNQNTHCESVNENIV